MENLQNDFYLSVAPNLQQDDGLFVGPWHFLPVFLNPHSRLCADTWKTMNNISKDFQFCIDCMFKVPSSG